MADSVPASGAEAEERIAPAGIAAMRHSLGLGETEAALVRRARERLAGEVEGWVDTFYRHLITDPEATPFLQDEGRVIRLKRSLVAWFHELFSLPFDEAYERTRASIGSTHVRIRLPQYLMVTSMGVIRSAVLHSVDRIYAEDPNRRELAQALSKTLDLELALMLGAYRREEHAEARQRDRRVYTERAFHRFQQIARNRIDQALCLAELASHPDHPDAEEPLAELRDTLRQVARMEYALRAPSDPTRTRDHVCLASLLREVVANAGGSHAAAIQVVVRPEDLSSTVYVEAVRLALEDVLHHASHASTEDSIRVVVARATPKGVAIEVHAVGSAWIDHVHSCAEPDGENACLFRYVAAIHGGAFEARVSGDSAAHLRMELPA